MIFSRFLRPKHQHKDPQERLKAIAELEPGNPEHKSALHELAFNDGNADVSLAALERLDSFPLWNKMAEIAADDKVRKTARKKIEALLLAGTGAGLDESQKREFILQSKDTDLLEMLLRRDAFVRQHIDLVQHILKRVDKPSLLNHVFFHVLDEAGQLALLPGYSKDSELQRVIRKVDNNNVRQAAEQLLAQRLDDARKPVEVTQATKLVLAKLLALRDINDYPAFEQRRTALQHEYQELSARFSYLDEAQTQEFSTKYHSLQEKLDNTEQQLQQQWQAVQQQQALQAQLDEAESQARKTLSALDETLVNALQSLTDELISQHKLQLQQARQKLQQALSENDVGQEPRRMLESLLNRLMASQTTVERFPALQAAVEQAHNHVQKFSERQIPDTLLELSSASQALHAAKQQYRGIKQEFAHSWPDSIDQQWKQATQAWNKALTNMHGEIKQSEARVRSKLRAVGNLINQGKFRPAMGLFKKVKGWYLALPEFSQQRLQRQYEQVRVDVEELQGWQEYIAQPRKPALLEQATTLVKQPVEDVGERANQVKQLRAEWNSLGVIASDEDSALNKAFDEALEAAFSPCREHFAELQQQRQQNLIAKQALLAEIHATDRQQSAEITEKCYRQFVQQWQAIGDVEHEQRDDITSQFRDAIEPFRKASDQFYQQNAQSKRVLVDKAKSLTESEDKADAAEQAKQLQQKWKTIGFAGNKQENKLWKEFRAVNDVIFAQFGEARQSVKKQLDDQLQQTRALLDGLEQSIQRVSDHTALRETEKLQSELHKQLVGLPTRQRQKIDVAVSNVDKALAQKRLQLQQQQQQQRYLALFDTLEAWQTGEQPDSMENLPAQFQQWFSSAEKNPGLSRVQLTVMLEILADRPSPDCDAELRKQLQLQMMADKLEKGEQQSEQHLLRQWVAHGPLAPDQQALLDRVKRVIMS